MFMELTQCLTVDQFHQTFLENVVDLEFTCMCSIPTVITETLMV